MDVDRIHNVQGGVQGQELPESRVLAEGSV